MRKKILTNGEWALITGQSFETVFTADTLEFKKIDFTTDLSDPIRLNPTLNFYTIRGDDAFDFTYSHKLDTLQNRTIALYSLDVQYGFWKLDR